MKTVPDVTHEARNKDEAHKILRGCKVNARFYLHASVDAALPDNPDKYIPGAFRASVQITRKVAERFIDDAFFDRLQERGAALKIRVVTGDKRSRYETVSGSFERVDYGEPRLYVYLG